MAGQQVPLLAEQKGFFTGEGLNMRLVEYSSLSDCRVAFEPGQVDAMTGTLIEVLQARENTQRKASLADSSKALRRSVQLRGSEPISAFHSTKGKLN